MEKSELRTSEELVNFIETMGIDKVLFMDDSLPIRTILGISFTSSNDKPFHVPCKIDESRYKIKDKYKITLKPVYDGLSTKHYYISDLLTLLKENHVQMYINCM